MNRKIIGLVGFIGSGKDTVADYLVKHHNFKKDSFAKSLKDVLSVLFNWDRNLLEGTTISSREWRNKIDTWWAKKLDIPHFTPRWAMQNIGTNLFRNHFHTDIWISTLEHRLVNTPDNIVISDARFFNEMNIIKQFNGSIIKISRGKNPEWYQDALLANLNDKNALLKMNELQIHPSEWNWINDLIDIDIKNDNDIDTLYSAIKNQVLDRLDSRLT